MIELVFPSDTNQQLAQQTLEAIGVKTQRGHAGCLEIDREALVAHLPAVEAALADYDGRIWAD
ncbi:MAG TPA: hypothetical protein VGD46_13395 [Rhizobacter sp.]